jgi:hypothetical protein
MLTNCIQALGGSQLPGPLPDLRSPNGHTIDLMHVCP